MQCSPLDQQSTAYAPHIDRWSDAILQSIAFALQLLSVLYWWLPAGYAIDHRKVVLVETVGKPTVPLHGDNPPVRYVMT